MLELITLLQANIIHYPGKGYHTFSNTKEKIKNCFGCFIRLIEVPFGLCKVGVAPEIPWFQNSKVA